MAEQEDRLIAEAQEEIEENERLRKLDEAEHLMAEAEAYLKGQKEEKDSNESENRDRSSERREMIVDVIVVSPSTSAEKEETESGERESGSEEESGDEEENESESEEEKEESDNSCLGYFTIFGALFIGVFSFFIFYPPKYNADLLWAGFANNCCSIYHNITRCILNVTCKSRLDLWIYSMNNTVDYFNNCCYIYGSYSSWLFFADRYCDPFCLRPKLF